MGSSEPLPMLILEDIHKFYDHLEVLKGISLEVAKGELVTFVGPSGCGKTTLLRIIGGFTPLDSGHVILDGQRIDHLPPNLRDTRICFQNYALFPHMSVGDNVGFGLRMRGSGKYADSIHELFEVSAAKFKLQSKGYQLRKDLFIRYNEQLRLF
jgi:ABC-type Fe3+/spermidine/putrescine transport system ATPase subunit